MHLGTGGDQSDGRVIRTCEPDDLMARAKKFWDHGRANPARRSGNKNTHR